MQNVRQSGHILEKLQFSKQIFEKYSDLERFENPSNGSRVVRTDRDDAVDSRFSQRCQRG
jgi:hypothetical protein